MKVLLINGSSREKGCTYTALLDLAAALNVEGIETEAFHIGNILLAECMNCGGCRETGLCILSDSINKFLKKAGTMDGFIFGLPIHYASEGEAIVSLIERAFNADTY